MLDVLQCKFPRDSEELARVAGDASMIVTGDRAMLALRTFRGININTLKDFLADEPRPDA